MISWKIACRLHETTIFKAWGLRKSIKNQQKTHTESPMRFLSHCYQNRPSFWPPKWSRFATEGLSKTGPKFDLQKKTKNLFLALTSRSPPYCLPVAASRHRKVTMGTYVQNMSMIKMPTEQELQKINVKVARWKQTCETDLKIRRPYWNRPKHIRFTKRKRQHFP